ncbi:MAG: prepilin peptidase [Terracidiphilus sp.]
MFRLPATAFAALVGLAFGSFLNVCVSRWPRGESVIQPGSHCRGCNRMLAWWENVPLASWIGLRGRCRTCNARIGCRYPLVECAVGALWAVAAWNSAPMAATGDLAGAVTHAVGKMILYWLLVALAALDAEHLWLPDRLTLPGIALGIGYTLLRVYFRSRLQIFAAGITVPYAAIHTAIAIVLAAGIILLIRGIYWLIRRREGIGLGDAKLMAMLAAWLGFSQAILAFSVGVVMGALAALVLLAMPAARKSQDRWSAMKLPLGTFLCVGGIVASLWGNEIVSAYLRWAGFR